MPALRPLAVLVGGLAFTAVSPAAFAGCGAPAASACNPGAVYSATPYQTAPVQVAYGQPYDHLSTVNFKQTPNVNVMRVQSGAALAPLSGAPTQFWGGCSNASGAPVSSPYCGAPAARPRPALGPSYAPAPAYRPAPAPMQSGSTALTPGHAYVSHNTIVHRMPPVMATPSEAAMLRSRQTTSYASSSYSAPSYSAGTSVGGGWKQVSGPTVVDGMLATQVLCKQPEAPARYAQVSQSYQVVRPVVEVGYPVPVAVRGNVCAAPKPRGFGRYGR